MIKTVRRILTLFFCILYFGGTAQTFEGRVETKYYDASSETNTKMIWYLKEGAVAMEMSFKTKEKENISKFIARENADSLLIITYEGASPSFYYNVSTDQIKGLGSIKAPSIQRSEEEREINERSCQKVTMKTPDGTKTTCWYTPNINVGLHKYVKFFANDPGIFLLNELKETGFPLSTQVTNAGGFLISSQEVKAIIEEKLSEELFQVPAGVPTIKEKMQSQLSIKK